MIPTQLPPGTDPTAVVGRRIAAYAIDILLVLLIVTPIGVWQFMDNATTVSDGTVHCTGDDNRGGTRGGAVPRASARVDSTFCVELGDDVHYLTGAEANRLTRLIWLLSVTTQVLNLIVLQGLTGASVGKLALGLRVVRMDTGRRAGFGWLILRTVLLFVDAFCFILPGLVLVSSTRGHRRIGDMAAGTLVVRREHMGHGPIPVPGLTAPAPTAGWGVPPAPGAPPHQPGGWAPPTAPPEQPGGWGSTAGTPGFESTRPAAEDPSTPSADGPTWDDARNTYIQYDRELAEWMEWDEAQRTWKPISR